MGRVLASTRDRGYGSPHRRLRDRLVSVVESGSVRCARCGWPIASGEEWELDHTDDRLGYLGPSHKFCNRSAPKGGPRPAPRVASRLVSSRVW